MAGLVQPPINIGPRDSPSSHRKATPLSKSSHNVAARFNGSEPNSKRTSLNDTNEFSTEKGLGSDADEAPPSYAACQAGEGGGYESGGRGGARFSPGDNGIAGGFYAMPSKCQTKEGLRGKISE